MNFPPATMKWLCALYFLSGVLYAEPLHAQFLDLTIPSGDLPSDISEWPDNPKLMSITLTAPDGIEVRNGHIVFEVREGSEHILAASKSRFAEQLPISGKFKKKNFSFTDITGDSLIVETDPSIKSPTSGIGKLPAGYFGLCFYLVDSAGNPVKEISQGCANFVVRDIDAPTLLTPSNETTVPANAPLAFSWTPARAPSQTVHYQLKLYRISPGQTPAQAMASSSAFYTSDDIFSPTYIYPADAPKLSTLVNVKGFVWIVTQFDQGGKYLGKNSGRSAPSVFYQGSSGK